MQSEQPLNRLKVVCTDEGVSLVEVEVLVLLYHDFVVLEVFDVALNHVQHQRLRCFSGYVANFDDPHFVFGFLLYLLYNWQHVLQPLRVCLLQLQEVVEVLLVEICLLPVQLLVVIDEFLVLGVVEHLRTDVFSCRWVVVPSDFVVAVLIEEIPMVVKEAAIRQNVEPILVVLSLVLLYLLLGVDPEPFLVKLFALHFILNYKVVSF